ncbi:MAG: 4-oxalomesaconate tautomerase, partial [Mesorhizobium sp.]
MNDLIRIPCALMRGGTSKGPFFLASDLPSDPAFRDQILLSVMGSGHPLQIDGIGGGNPVTSKVAIVGPASIKGADVDYLFAQVRVDQQ